MALRERRSASIGRSTVALIKARPRDESAPAVTDEAMLPTGDEVKVPRQRR